MNRRSFLKSVIVGSVGASVPLTVSSGKEPAEEFEDNGWCVICGYAILNDSSSRIIDWPEDDD